MINASYKRDGQTLTIEFSGRIDASLATDVEKAIMEVLEKEPFEKIILNCERLVYLSSAGIRVVLRLAKKTPAFQMIDVSSDVYSVLDMTGLTEMIPITKAYRHVSIIGCPIIGQGANGVVYRIDPETIVKVHRHPDTLPTINRERELSRAAFVAGIPTAIPYDVVVVDDGRFGTVFELLNAISMADLLIRGEYTVEDVARESVELLKQMADTEVDPNVMSSIRDDALTWIEDVRGILSDEQVEKLQKMISAIPDTNRMVHGDFHIKNVMVQDGEPLLIDLDTLSHGNPVFDLATTYSAYVGYGAARPSKIDNFLGVSHTVTAQLWDLILHGYFADLDEEQIRKEEDKIRLVSALRLMGQPRRHGKENTPEGQETIATYKKIIDELLPHVDELAL